MLTCRTADTITFRTEAKDSLIYRVAVLFSPGMINVHLYEEGELLPIAQVRRPFCVPLMLGVVFCVFYVHRHNGDKLNHSAMAFHRRLHNDDARSFRDLYHVSLRRKR